MSRTSHIGFDASAPPFDRHKHVQRLVPARSGHHAAVLYGLLAGSRWTDDNDVRTRVEPDTDLDTELKQVLLTALAPVPDDRYRSVTEFRAALGAYLERIWPGRAW
ncbi:MAG: hypothetical protein ABI634_08695 [Acidobacteriota bacterium]